jgi:ribosomal protein S18 acetylase RimI-like enzyme
MTCIMLAELANPSHARAVVDLLDHYARDIMGGGLSLSVEVREALIPKLQAQPGCRVFLAEEDGVFLGLAICFTGFSTFQARPLLNVHDLAVHASARGRGIGRKLLAAIEADALALGCCKLTLEVRADNHNARHLYESFGFEVGERDTTAMSFFTKKL